jgi:hypothetical protein
MHYSFRRLLTGCLLTVFFFTACGITPVQTEQTTSNTTETTRIEATIAAIPAPPSPSPTPTPVPTPETIRTDYAAFSANESGRIPILMFHRFVDAYTEKSEPNYTTTFKEFEALLQTLYDRNFRLIGLQQFLSSDIAVPAGKHPIVFTFDDGTAGQFNLIKNEQDELVVNPQSAVGIIMAFTETHPDFGIGGTFYLNMDIYNSVFAGEGTLTDRFDFLVKNGFELGNHTWEHVDFRKTTTVEAIQKAVGKNQLQFSKSYPNYQFASLSLPYGFTPRDKSLIPDILSGTYETTTYENKGLLAVGAEPSIPAHHIKFDPTYINRVRGQGRNAVEADLTWWLEKMSDKTLYISDGDPKTIVVPASKEALIQKDRLTDKTLVIWQDNTETVN